MDNDDTAMGVRVGVTMRARCYRRPRARAAMTLPGLKCLVLSVDYDFQRRTGRLYMPPGNCCDMQGCIRHFLGIDPAVRIIETFAGGVRDTCYKRAADGWRVSYVP
jgi:hypothetical protein